MRFLTARWVVGAAVACAALVVGGVLAWNALRDDTGTVVVTAEDPPVPDPGAPEAGDEPGPDAAGATPAGASDSGGVAGASEDERPTGIGEDEPTGIGEDEPTGIESEDPAEPQPPTPEELSTGPVLEWTEIEPGIESLSILQSVGDGRVLARTWPFAGAQDYGGGQVYQTAQVLVTSNGTDWSEVPVPDGVSPDQVDISGDRWLVAGPDTSSEPLSYARFGPSSSLVFFSDDEGTTWTELDIDLPADPEVSSPWLVERSAVTSALVSGERIVLVVQGYTTLDARGLLEDRGLLPEGKDVGWATTVGDGAVFTLFDVPGPDDLWAGDSPGDEETLEVSIEELGLTAEEQAALGGPDSSRVSVLSSDGSTVELTARYEGFGATGVATGRGFELTIFADRDPLVLTSPDGIVWSEERPSWDDYSGRTVVAGGTVWRTVSEPFEGFGVQRGDDGQTPATVATFEGLAPAGDLAAGPAGVTVSAFVVADSDGSAGTGAVVPEGRVAKDGYELRYNEPEGGVTLWDLAADAPVYEFGPEVVASETPPDGVREIDDNGSFAVVFEDPDTGVDLVTFTEDDLSPIFEASLPEGDMYEPPELWVGWSADGARWGWQTVADAFGIDEEGESWAQLGVGRDFVIAQVQVFPRPEPSDTTAGQSGVHVGFSAEAVPPRWFIARVR